MSTFLNKKNSIARTRGFTLIELMVSLAIFSIVMTISVGTLLTLVDLNSKAQAIYSATTNLSFAIDSMTRELRMGYNYNCTTNNTIQSNGTKNDCLGTPTGGQDLETSRKIFFTRSRDGVLIGYRLNGTTLEMKEGGDAWSPVTSSDVYITKFLIEVENTAPYNGAGNTKQPWITLRIEGYSKNGLEAKTSFNLQTRMLQRRLDII